MNGEDTACVTGGPGRLGSHLIERLPREGYRVRAIVRRTSDVSHLESLDVELVRGDITDPAGGSAMTRRTRRGIHCDTPHAGSVRTARTFCRAGDDRTSRRRCFTQRRP